MEPVNRSFIVCLFFNHMISNLEKNVSGVLHVNAAHFKHGEPGLHEEHEKHANPVVANTAILIRYNHYRFYDEALYAK